MDTFGDIKLLPVPDLNNDPTWGPIMPLFAAFSSYGIGSKIYPRGFLVDIFAERMLFLGSSRPLGGPNHGCLLGLVIPRKTNPLHDSWDKLGHSYISSPDSYSQCLQALHAIPDLGMHRTRHDLLAFMERLESLGPRPADTFKRRIWNP